MMIFAYLAIFFLVFRFYTRLVLSEYQINYFEYGLTLLKALALAKIILTAEALRLGDRFRERPLIVPTLYATLVFSAFALAFEILEHIIIGLFRGKGPSEGTTITSLIVFATFLEHLPATRPVSSRHFQLLKWRGQ